MNSRVLAIRAISSTYVLQILRPIAFMVVGTIVGISAIVTYLSIYWSAWWLLFFVLFTALFVIIVVAIFTALSVARAVAPPMDKHQKELALNYVKNMHDVNDSIATPQFMIVFKIIVDLFKRRWQGGFVQSTTANSVRLKADFDKLSKTFE